MSDRRANGAVLPDGDPQGVRVEIGSRLSGVRRPLIAVSTSEIRDAALRGTGLVAQGEPPRRDMVLGLSYLRALEAAGAVPAVVPPLGAASVATLIDRVDGICLSGGPDIDPTAYGGAGHPELGPTEPSLDAFELALARAADERGLPILAICRGLQLLNVSRGGALHQHLPDVVGTGVEHRQVVAGTRATHWVSLQPTSVLAATLGRGRSKVNSFHHQGIDRLGAELTEVAWATDGTIEAVEDVSRPFLVGVQWHAESLVHRREHRALFHAFVAACERYERSTEPLARVA